jgi:hypothetical protein
MTARVHCSLFEVFLNARGQESCIFAQMVLRRGREADMVGNIVASEEVQNTIHKWSLFWTEESVRVLCRKYDRNVGEAYIRVRWPG